MNRTELRHRMLAEIDAGPTIYLDCVNQRQSMWKPRRDTEGQFNLSSAEARAVNELLVEHAHTPHWQGDMDVYREPELTDAGRALLAEWNEKYGAGAL